VSSSSEVDTTINQWLAAIRVQPSSGHAELINICISLLNILRHDNESLLREWSVELFEIVEENLLYTRSKLILILGQKRIIQDWGEKWGQFITDIELLLEQDHRDLSFHTKAMKKSLEISQDNAPQSKNTLATLEEQKQLHRMYGEYSLEYEHLANKFSNYIDNVST
jgi:hypothetical protein